MALKPWYKVVTPREDLREGKPLDASEFAVHLDQIRDGRAPLDYQRPELFFERTYLTASLAGLAAEVIRRLSGERTETNAVFNMATQFGGGKTHALTLLYHLAHNGRKANEWAGVQKLLERACVSNVPEAATAVFVGTEFDSLEGRGDEGEPVRMTPWGEVAWQIGGEEAFRAVEKHDRERVAPGGDVIRKFLPAERPCLILIDELMNYISRNRKSGLAAQFYNFVQNLSEESRGRNNTVLAVSIPASEMEMSAEDQLDYDRLKKMLDRLGKAVMMSAEGETSEIIRRRLFEWDAQAVSQDGRVLPGRDALQTCNEYADWVIEHRQQLPALFDIDNARQVFVSTYPFHPMALSVFERKWQALPRFQRTRGVLRLLALWVSRAYQEGFKGAHKDLLIGPGTAPLDDPLFRAAVFEQLGEPRLEVVVTTDICGKTDAHAVRLDKEAVDSIRKARLHRKVATTIFLESNGGTVREEATVPEVRLAVAEPDIDIGNVETVLEELNSSCYFLTVEKNRYRFSLSPNLNKMLADRRASIQKSSIDERIQEEVREVFSKGTGADRIYFPEKSAQISDRAALSLVVLEPTRSMRDEKTMQMIETMTREAGTSSRVFKSALIWCVAESDAALQEEARKLLAWEDIEAEDLDRLDDSQKRQLAENLKRAQKDLTESVWRAYKNVVLLGKDNALRVVDLGLVTSSSAGSMVAMILGRLGQDGDISEAIHPNFIVRNWPPALKEWSTRQVRDVFFASPQFPRLLNANSVKDTIARGVSGGLLAYVGKTTDGDYDPCYFNMGLSANEVEISEEMFIIMKATYEEYRKAKESPSPEGAKGEGKSEGKEEGQAGEINDGNTGYGPAAEKIVEAEEKIERLMWSGEVPAQKWMVFYNKVLTRFAIEKGLKLVVSIEVWPKGGLSAHSIEETRSALREIGLSDDIKSE